MHIDSVNDLYEFFAGLQNRHGVVRTVSSIKLLA